METMWVLCEEGTPGARKMPGYPKGSVYIKRESFPDDVVRQCRRKAWNLLFKSDGMDAPFETDTFVLSGEGELKGHYYGGTILWYDDFSEGGEHFRKYRRVGGDLVRLGFSRW